MEVALSLAAATYTKSDISHDLSVPLLLMTTVGAIIALVVLCMGCAEGCKQRRKRKQTVEEIPLMELHVQPVPDGLAHSDHQNPQVVDQVFSRAIPKSNPQAIPYNDNRTHQSSDDFEPSGRGYELLSRWYETGTPTNHSLNSLLEGNKFNIPCGPESGRLFLPAIRILPKDREDEHQKIPAELRSRYLDQPHRNDQTQLKSACAKCEPKKGNQSRHSKHNENSCVQRYIKPSRLDKPESLPPRYSDVQKSASGTETPLPHSTSRHFYCRSLPESATKHVTDRIHKLANGKNHEEEDRFNGAKGNVMADSKKDQTKS